MLLDAGRGRDVALDAVFLWGHAQSLLVCGNPPARRMFRFRREILRLEISQSYQMRRAKGVGEKSFAKRGTKAAHRRFGGLQEQEASVLQPAPPPAAAELVIVHFADGWRILVGGQRQGRYRYRVDAEEAALRLQAKARANGEDLAIVVQDPRGELQRLALT
jgi:hypothetical protein